MTQTVERRTPAAAPGGLRFQLGVAKGRARAGPGRRGRVLVAEPAGPRAELAAVAPIAARQPRSPPQPRRRGAAPCAVGQLTVTTAPLRPGGRRSPAGLAIASASLGVRRILTTQAVWAKRRLGSLRYSGALGLTFPPSWMTSVCEYGLVCPTGTVLFRRGPRLRDVRHPQRPVSSPAALGGGGSWRHPASGSSGDGSSPAAAVGHHGDRRRACWSDQPELRR
jgi:hypothetical protein